MAQRKYGDAKKVEVLRGHEASALDKLEARFGKRIADFDDEERSTLHEELESARKKNEADAEKDSTKSEE